MSAKKTTSEHGHKMHALPFEELERKVRDKVEEEFANEPCIAKWPHLYRYCLIGAAICFTTLVVHFNYNTRRMPDETSDEATVVCLFIFGIIFGILGANRPLGTTNMDAEIRLRLIEQRSILLQQQLDQIKGIAPPNDGEVLVSIRPKVQATTAKATASKNRKVTAAATKKEDTKPKDNVELGEPKV